MQAHTFHIGVIIVSVCLYVVYLTKGHHINIYTDSDCSYTDLFSAHGKR